MTAPTPRDRGLLAGMAAAAVTLGLAELGAALVPGALSPVRAVARTVISTTPTRLREALVGSVGTADKPALLVGIVLVVLLLGGLLGAAAVGSRDGRRAGVLLLSLVAFVLVLQQPGAYPGPAGLVLLAASVAGVAILELLLPAAAGPADATPQGEGLDRRRFLAATGGAVLVAGSAFAASRLLAVGRSVEAVRAAVTLPRPGRRTPVVRATAEPAVAGLSPLVTANDRFYKVDTSVGGDPQVDPAHWSLKVVGLVERPLDFTYAQLRAMPQTEAWITLGCVGNPVGGPLVGTALWQGVLLADVLRAARPRAKAAQVVGRSVDGYTGAFPLPLALDGRSALIALGMNGEPLPVAHGFPARLVVPGLYGYESGVKWLDRIELASQDYQAFWVQRGYSKQAEFRTQSRIDVPTGQAPLRAGGVQVAGMAWAPHRGISRVEVSVDDGPWQPAVLALTTLGTDAWRPWTWGWQATPGRHELRVRATDGAGQVQPGRFRGVLPDGATGWHKVVVVVIA